MKNVSEIKSNSEMNDKTIFFLRILFMIFTLAILFAAGSIPFYFESQSMFYKFGIDRILLRAGKILGITTFTLIILQTIIMSKFDFINKIFTNKNLFTAHKINGICIAVFALSHPILVSASNSFNIIKIEFKYWPEFIGIFLLVLIQIIVITAMFRDVFKLTFKGWRILHIALTFIASVIMYVHVLFTSDAFEAGSTPRIIVFYIFGFYCILFSRLKYKNYKNKRSA